MIARNSLLRDKNYFYTLCLIFSLSLIGLLVLFSSLHYKGELVGKSIFFRQLIWVFSGWILLFFFSRVNYRVFFELSWVIYGITLLSLLAVLVLGDVRMGARRWIEIGFFSFQPSEFAKIAVLFLAARFYAVRLGRGKGYLRSFWHEVVAIFLPFLPAFFLVFKQPDLGTTLVIVFLLLLMGFGCGMKKRNIIVVFLVCILMVPLGSLFLKEYQKERIAVFLNPNIDPLGMGYTITQSKIAIGSGQVFGKGFLSGTQGQLNFIPARHTDFIFTLVGEEWGFFGALILLGLYFFLMQIILDISFSCRDKFGFCLGIGIYALFFVHIMINIAMVIGFLPVVGIPLAFLSYGGSYMFLNFMLIGVLLNIHRQNRYL